MLETQWVISFGNWFVALKTSGAPSVSGISVKYRLNCFHTPLLSLQISITERTGTRLEYLKWYNIIYNKVHCLEFCLVF